MGNFNFVPAKQRASFKRVYDKSQRTPTLEDGRIGSVCSESVFFSSSVNDPMTRMLKAENCEELGSSW